VASDPTACGAACATCPTGGVCQAGTCRCPDAAPTLCGNAPGLCVDLATDEAHCGDCLRSCAAGQVCTAGTCCAPGQLACGPSGARLCCAGTACCGDACQTIHSNGLGGTFLDCNPLGTWTRDAALAAADAWGSGTTFDGNFCGPGSLSRQAATACATWFYAGSALPGVVVLNTLSAQCLCPPQGAAGTWD
jgi:hypothetical protein